MKRNIADIIAFPAVFNNRSLTIEGVCRTVCKMPFPHFTLEDKTGTMLCKSSDGLPGIGTHIEVTGDFVTDVPTNCTVAVPRLNEAHRQYVGHHEKCSFFGCEFENAKPPLAA